MLRYMSLFKPLKSTNFSRIWPEDSYYAQGNRQA